MCNHDEVADDLIVVPRNGGRITPVITNRLASPVILSST